MDVFISYRRDGGIEIARNIKMKLNQLGYTTFFDNDSIREGKFNQQIIKNIEVSDNFIMVLSPNALDRCVDENDWVRKEIEVAAKQKINIIPVFCAGFHEPDGMPDFIHEVLQYQGITYYPLMFEESMGKIVGFLKDKNGNALRISKKENVSNTFYQEGHMSAEEEKRIQNDYEVVKKIETKIWDELLHDREGVVLFAPAVYSVRTYMKKYCRKEIAHIYGLVNSEREMEKANEQYQKDGHMFYKGNMANDDFEDVVDRILSDNELSGFDFADLTLILRDLSQPIEKLKIIVDRMNPNGIVYVREFDHGTAQAYPDENGIISKLLDLIKKDSYSGDFYAGRKVYHQMNEVYLENIHMAHDCVTTIGMKRRERETLFDALFSYVPREYKVLLENDNYNKFYKDSVDWLSDNYDTAKRKFTSDNDFFYRAGHMFFWGYVED